MLCEDLFFRLPVRDTYRETKHHAVFLRAHPTVARICFVIEVIVCVVIFAYSYHITANTSTTDTKISYEVLDVAYSCEVLSPKSNSESYNAKTSDAAFFSKARMSYETCLSTLDSTGFNMCSDDVRQDYVFNVIGMSSNDDNCFDIILANEYRFCYSKQSLTELQDYTDFKQAFTKRNTPFISSDAFFYFTKGDGTIITLSDAFNPASSSVLMSDYVSDLKDNVYVVAKDVSNNNRPTIFQFSVTTGTVQKLRVLTVDTLSGITYGDQALFVYEITGQQGKIFTYNVTSRIDSSMTISCTDFGQSVGTVTGADVRYLSYGSDGNLYAMCLGDTVVKSRSGNPPVDVNYKEFDFYQINLKTLTTRKFGSNLNALNFTVNNVESNQAIDEIAQVFFSRGSFYFLTKMFNNVIQANINSAQMMAGVQTIPLQALNFLTINDGDSLTTGRDQNIYLANGNHQYIDTLTKTVKRYEDLGTSSYYATAIEVGFSYQVCNNVLSNYTIDYETSSSFYAACQQYNG